VDSGISEKSIRLSGIGLALFAARLPSAPGGDRLFAIFQPPNGVNEPKDHGRRQFSGPH
jgi:hypothetical protein